MSNRLIWGIFYLLIFSHIGCSQQEFSLSSEQQVFNQNISTSRKLDILFVIDNSGSMGSSQENLANNLSSFISSFSQRGLDFKIAVTTTDAYLADLTSNPELSRFHGGVLTSSTPNLEAIFRTNVQVGIRGAGDERAFQSIRSTLSNTYNQGFLRSGSFLSVIILSDEDDFSWDGTGEISDVNSDLLHPTARYIDYLDALTMSSSGDRRYSVSSISILDQQCLASLLNSSQRISSRYNQIVAATGGVLGSLCSNFATTLASISGRVLELLTQFRLSRQPVVDSIRVSVNGVPVRNDSINGWTYDSALNSIIFHGTEIPAQGQRTAVDFVPLSSR